MAIQQTFDKQLAQVRLQQLTARETAALKATEFNEDVAEILANKQLSGYQKFKMVGKALKEKRS